MKIQEAHPRIQVQQRQRCPTRIRPSRWCRCATYSPRCTRKSSAPTSRGPSRSGQAGLQFRRAVGTKGGDFATMMWPVPQIDPKALAGRSTITVQQVAFDILKLPAASRKTLADITFQMVKLGWKRGREFPATNSHPMAAQLGMQNWYFSATSNRRRSGTGCSSPYPQKNQRLGRSAQHRLV